MTFLPGDHDFLNKCIGIYAMVCGVMSVCCTGVL